MWTHTGKPVWRHPACIGAQDDLSAELEVELEQKRREHEAREEAECICPTRSVAALISTVQDNASEAVALMAGLRQRGLVTRSEHQSRGKLLYAEKLYRRECLRQREAWRLDEFPALHRMEEQGRREAAYDEVEEGGVLWRRFREFRYVPRYVEKRLAEALLAKRCPDDDGGELPESHGWARHGWLRAMAGEAGLVPPPPPPDRSVVARRGLARWAEAESRARTRIIAAAVAKRPRVPAMLTARPAPPAGCFRKVSLAAERAPSRPTPP